MEPGAAAQAVQARGVPDGYTFNVPAAASVVDSVEQPRRRGIVDMFRRVNGTCALDQLGGWMSV